mgnify:CR=1 FL=1
MFDHESQFVSWMAQCAKASAAGAYLFISSFEFQVSFKHYGKKSKGSLTLAQIKYNNCSHGIKEYMNSLPSSIIST